MDYSIGILAGGKSSRFGSDKRFALLGSETFLSSSILRFSSFPEVLVSLEKDSSIPLPSSVKGVFDEKEDQGPLEGIRRILSASSFDYVFVLPVDMPYVGPEVAEYLASFLKEGTEIVAPVVQGREFPLAAIYHKSLLPRLTAMEEKGDRKLRHLFSSSSVVFVDMTESGFSDETFLNVNEAGDLKKL